MQRACDLAQECGIGMVLATHSNHFGTAGWFARKASERGYAALVWSQCESLVVPFGGTERFSGTNPLCMSMPRSDAEAITLDMATSAVPLGKIETAKVTTGVIPPDWAVDAEGRPTTDPHLAYALQPMAGPKGSGLAMLIDLLSGGLAGTGCGPRIHRLYDDFEDEQNLAHTFIAIKAGAFAAEGTTDNTVAEMISDLSRQSPAEGFDEVLLPGEIEARKHAKGLSEGIAVPATLIESLRALGGQIGLDFPD
jgi:LDH2 family malate/lactate/ureidoglycolate dehydrogenase